MEVVIIDRITEIKNRVQLIDVLQDAGIKLIKNMACCPFHSEKTPSFSVKNNRYKCFSCGEGGDVIDFVSRYYNISPIEAEKKLDNDYNLGVFHELSAEEKKEIAKQRRERERLKAYKKELNAVRDRIYNNNCRRYHRLQRLIGFCHPEICGINDLYIKAYNEVQYLEHWFEEEQLYGLHDR